MPTNLVYLPPGEISHGVSYNSHGAWGTVYTPAPVPHTSPVIFTPNYTSSRPYEPQSNGSYVRVDLIECCQGFCGGKDWCCTNVVAQALLYIAGFSCLIASKDDPPHTYSDVKVAGIVLVCLAGIYTIAAPFLNLYCSSPETRPLVQRRENESVV